MSFSKDTIVALSSGGLPSGVAVIRLSGPRAISIAENMCGGALLPRFAHLRPIIDPETKDVVDEGLVLSFPSPQSFTGEDCAEFQVHGSKAVVSRLLAVLSGFRGVRLARAGEFSQRAFENGKFDLTANEGLRDLIAAETEHQRAQAMSRFSGQLRVQISDWRSILIRQLSLIEANLDFSDEGDVSDFDVSILVKALQQLAAEWQAALQGFSQNVRVREGVRIVLIGAPNVGKSSLINSLAQDDVAIVTAEAGTTRDVREVRMDFAGNLAILVDTAGLRDSESLAEREGVRRAKAELSNADIIIHLTSHDTQDVLNNLVGLDSSVVIRVNSKADLCFSSNSDVNISNIDGSGMTELVNLLSKQVDVLSTGASGLISHARDKSVLVEALEITAPLLSLLEDGTSEIELELVSEDLRQIIYSLDRLVGRVDVEDMLDDLFSGFCIGK